jgi:hypothetical protein
MKARAEAFVAHLEMLREAGGGSLSAAELFSLVGAPQDSRIRQLLESRGSLDIVFEDEHHGQFSNRGPALVIPVGPVRLHVPPKITGRVGMTGGQVTLDFDPAETLVARVMIMEVKVKSVEVSPHHMAVRVPGGAFDQEYRF